MPDRPPAPVLHLLRSGDFRAFLIAIVLAGLGESALSVLLGVTVYQLARDPMALGWLGLVEAGPAIGLVLIGGHVADRLNRRSVTILARCAMAGLCLALAGVVALPAGTALKLIYGVAFLIGCVRAFEEPANSGLEAQVVPFEQAVRAASLLGSVSRAFRLGAPVAGGVLYDLAGPTATYAVLASLIAASAATLLAGVPSRPHLQETTRRHGMLEAIAEGIRYVFSNQVIVGSMALDLFAVFFGGVAGLLPVFAIDILHVGPAGVGLLRAAMSAGALAAMLAATRFPPAGRAGVVLHLAIAGFGCAIVVFGLSTSFVLSMAALFVAGVCDGVSVVIRHAILRLVAPDGMRGRIAAVRMVFINSSNELGDFESGMAAAWLGPAVAVWGGGLATLAIVGVTAWRAPKLLALDLRTLRRPP